MTWLQIFILIAWVMLPVLAAVFLLLFGPPSRYRDRTMAWHLWLTTAIAGLEPVGFLLSGLSLAPAALIYMGSLGVMGWRIGLLIRARKRSSAERTKRRSQPSMEE